MAAEVNPMADKVGTDKAVGEVAGPDRGASEKAVPARIDVPDRKSVV